jgi:hypothetical protein
MIQSSRHAYGFILLLHLILLQIIMLKASVSHTILWNPNSLKSVSCLLAKLLARPKLAAIYLISTVHPSLRYLSFLYCSSIPGYLRPIVVFANADQTLSVWSLLMSYWEQRSSIKSKRDLQKFVLGPYCVLL